MKHHKKSASPGGTGLAQNEIAEKAQTHYLPILAIAPAITPIGWRGALAAGNGRFRASGTYDYAPSDRAIRRMVARMEKKRGAK